MYSSNDAPTCNTRTLCTYILSFKWIRDGHNFTGTHGTHYLRIVRITVHTGTNRDGPHNKQNKKKPFVRESLLWCVCVWTVFFIYIIFLFSISCQRYVAFGILYFVSWCRRAKRLDDFIKSFLLRFDIFYETF